MFSSWQKKASAPEARRHSKNGYGLLLGRGGQLDLLARVHFRPIDAGVDGLQVGEGHAIRARDLRAGVTGLDHVLTRTGCDGLATLFGRSDRLLLGFLD